MANELVRNRPLSGEELRRIILKDVDDILSRDGMYSLTMGYGRVSYKVRIQMHLDNPSYPLHEANIRSRPVSNNTLATHPELGAIHSEPPLPDPTDESLVFGVERERTIDSPNHARLEHGLPITIDVKNRETGQLEEKNVNYDAAGLEPGPVSDKDITDELGGPAEWNLTRRGKKKGSK